ncbi:MAG: Fur family transcriptional regulator [Bacteroidales bacterium]|nr:Fur family transcriptional regulator [Bacteroidales bacterium]
MNLQGLTGKMKEKGLKVTPQRIAVLEALQASKGHPSAEIIYETVRKKNPNIAVATIYKILQTFEKNDIIRRINTGGDIIRYDADLHHHHHLYSSESERVVDYNDEQLSRLLEDYFKEKQIPGFRIEEIQLQINGEFTNKSNK